MLERVITQPDNYEPFLLSQAIRFGDLAIEAHARRVATAGINRHGRRQAPSCIGSSSDTVRN